MLTVLSRRLRLIMVFFTMMLLVHGSWASTQHLQPMHAEQQITQPVTTMLMQAVDAHCPQQVAAQQGSDHRHHQHQHAQSSDGLLSDVQHSDCQDCAIWHHCGQLSAVDLSPQLAQLEPQHGTVIQTTVDVYQFNSIAYSTQPLLRPPRD